MKRLLRSAPLVILFAGAALAQSAAPARFSFDEALAAGERPLTASKAAALAVESSPDLAEARARRDRAEAAVDTARVGLLPRIDAEGRAGRVGGFDDGSIIGPAGAVPIIVPRTRYGVRGRVSYPITGVVAGVRPKVRAAREQVDVEAEGVVATRAETELAGVEAFATYVEARGLLAVALASGAQADDQLRRIQASFAAGYLVEPDLRAAEARVAAARDDEVHARAAVAMARTSLEEMLGLAPGGEFALGGAFDGLGPALPRDLDRLVARAFQDRPELRAARASLRAQEARIASARAGLWPQLGVYAQGDYASPNPYVVPPIDDLEPSWELGIGLSWSPNDAAVAQRSARELRHANAEIGARLDGLTRAVRLEVRRALLSVEQAEESTRSAQARLDAAEIAYDARLAQALAGRVIFTDVVEADTDVTRARLAVLRARIARLIADAHLRRAIGAPLI